MAVERREQAVPARARLHAAAVGMSALALLLGAGEPFGAGSVLEPLQAQSGQQAIWVVSRGVALWLVLRVTDERRDSRARTLVLLAVGLFVASLAASVFAVPLLALSVFVTSGGGDTSALARRWGGVLGVLGASAALSPFTARPFARVPGGEPPNAAAAAVMWLERDNPFRARSAASVWAAAEGEHPGDGTLILAELEWSLGHREGALRRVGSTAARAATPEVARRATALRERWLRERP